MAKELKKWKVYLVFTGFGCLHSVYWSRNEARRVAKEECGCVTQRTVKNGRD